MRKHKYFRSLVGKRLPLPVFFPDATRAVLRTLDSVDIANTKTPGILINTYHLYRDLDPEILKKFGGIREFMGWDGAVISDSGGFQVMSLAKRTGYGGRIVDEGVIFKSGNKEILFTPKDSIEYQMNLNTDMVVVLDDFTPANASRKIAQETLVRTILWAKKSKSVFERYCERHEITNKPYLLGVVQGGDYHDLRRQCIERLCEIGFDGLGFGGWAIKEDGSLDLELSKFIADNTPEDYLLYGLGVGKPEDIVALTKMGYQIYDCVLPTRDARHGRLYVYDDKNFYTYYSPSKSENATSSEPVSKDCDCLLCKNYSRAYLKHLYNIGDSSYFRLATIHNLRFYSRLMEKLKANSKVQVGRL